MLLSKWPDRLILSCALISLFGSPNVAQAVPTIPAPAPKMTTPSITPMAALERFFKIDKALPDWFTKEFVAAVPIEQVQAIITQLKQELGTFEGVKPDGEDFIIQFSQGSVPTQIVLTNDGKISGLRYGAPIKKIANLEDAIVQFKALPGKVSLLVLEHKIGQPKTVRASLNPTTSLGVGSAFKLAVLDVLKSQIAAKKLTWQTVVPLQAQSKSLPSGRLQTWPDGSLLTVQSLAAMMISESDNTATDHLIQLLGRENIEAISPQNKPFLMTREFFQLKSKRNQPILQRYQKADIAQKRSILAELAKLPLPAVSEFEGSQPTALDVEWFFTAEQLCQHLDRVSDLPLLGINPGIAQSKDWQTVAYKGGSEAGVMNLTTGLTAKNGQRYCVVATWNHDQQAIDEAKLVGLYGGILALLQPKTPN